MTATMTYAPILKLTPPRVSSSPTALKRNSASRSRSTSSSTSPSSTMSSSSKSQQKRKKSRPSLAASVRPVHILPELLEVEDEEEQIVDSSFMDLGNEDEEVSVKRTNNKRASRTRSIGLSGLKYLAQGVESLLLERNTLNVNANANMNDSIDNDSNEGEKNGNGLTLLTIDLGGMSLAFPSPPSATSTSRPTSPVFTSSTLNKATHSHSNLLSPITTMNSDMERVFNPRASSPTLSSLSLSGSESASTSPTPTTPQLSENEDETTVRVNTTNGDNDHDVVNHIEQHDDDAQEIDFTRYSTYLSNQQTKSLKARKRPIPRVAPLVIAKRAFEQEYEVQIERTSVVPTPQPKPTTCAPHPYSAAAQTEPISTKAKKFTERDSVKQMFAPLDRVSADINAKDLGLNLESVWERIVRRESFEKDKVQTKDRREKQRGRVSTILEEDENEEAQWVDVIDDYSLPDIKEGEDDEEAIEFYKNDMGGYLEILEGLAVSTPNTPRGSFSKNTRRRGSASSKNVRRSSVGSIASIGSIVSKRASTSSISRVKNQLPQTPTLFISTSSAPSPLPKTPKTPRTPKTPKTPLTPRSLSTMRRQKSLGHRHAAASAAAAAARRRGRTTGKVSSASLKKEGEAPPVPTLPSITLRAEVNVEKFAFRPPPRMEIPSDIDGDGSFFDDDEHEEEGPEEIGEDLGEVLESFQDPFSPAPFVAPSNTQNISVNYVRKLPDAPLPVSPLTPVTPYSPSQTQNAQLQEAFPPRPAPSSRANDSSTQRNIKIPTRPPPPPPIEKHEEEADKVSLFDESRVLRSRWSSSTLSTLADNSRDMSGGVLKGLTRFPWFSNTVEKTKTAVNTSPKSKQRAKARPNLPPVIISHDHEYPAYPSAQLSSFFDPDLVQSTGSLDWVESTGSVKSGSSNVSIVGLRRSSSEKGLMSARSFAGEHVKAKSTVSKGDHYYSHSTVQSPPYSYPNRHNTNIRARVPYTPTPPSSSSPSSSSSSPSTPSPTCSHTHSRSRSPTSPLFTYNTPSPSKGVYGKTIRRSLSRSSSTASEFSMSSEDSGNSTASSGRRRKPIPVEIFMRGV